jgi:hypothetical protein
MRRSIPVVSLLAVFAALQSGCASASSGATDISGNWSGTYADTKTSVTGPLAASFTEQNGTLSGTLTISSGWLCSASSQGNVSGNVSGNQVQASATFGLVATLSFDGDVSDTTISGTYQITSGVCAGGSGSFSLSR